MWLSMFSKYMLPTWNPSSARVSCRPHRRTRRYERILGILPRGSRLKTHLASEHPAPPWSDDRRGQVWDGLRVYGERKRQQVRSEGLR